MNAWSATARGCPRGRCGRPLARTRVTRARKPRPDLSWTHVWTLIVHGGGRPRLVTIAAGLHAGGESR
jgi:hypothetical protein